LRCCFSLSRTFSDKADREFSNERAIGTQSANPAAFASFLPGQRFDTVGVKPLIDGLEFGALLADKAFDSNEIIADLDRRGAKVVISQHPRRPRPISIDTKCTNGVI
jgi:hypothetical protein